MMDQILLEKQLSELPLFNYFFIDPKDLVFSQRIRYVCQNDCPQYGKSWACPPGVGTVEECRSHCLSFERGLLISTIVEVEDIADMEATLATRRDHEAVTDQVRELFRSQGIDPFVLSTESCAICPRCAILDGQPCRFPDRMHPCVESQGIVLTDTLEKHGIDFQYGSNIVTWFSLLLFHGKKSPLG